MPWYHTTAVCTCGLNPPRHSATPVTTPKNNLHQADSRLQKCRFLQRPEAIMVDPGVKSPHDRAAARAHSPPRRRTSHPEAWPRQGSVPPMHTRWRGQNLAAAETSTQPGAGQTWAPRAPSTYVQAAPGPSNREPQGTVLLYGSEDLGEEMGFTEAHAGVRPLLWCPPREMGPSAAPKSGPLPWMSWRLWPAAMCVGPGSG